MEDEELLVDLLNVVMKYSNSELLYIIQSQTSFINTRRRRPAKILDEDIKAMYAENFL